MKTSYKNPFRLVVQPTFEFEQVIKTKDQPVTVLGYVVSIHDGDGYHIYDAFGGEVFPTAEMARERIGDIQDLEVEHPEDFYRLRNELRVWAEGICPDF